MPEARAAVLALLALPDTRVALVSGRALRSLEAVADLPDEVLLVGSHGVEIRLDSDDIELVLDEGELEQRGVLSDVLGQVADSLDEVWIEEKPAGFALHTRLATEKHSRIAHLVATQEAQAEVDGLKVRSGKDVLEFSIRQATKGEAVEHLRRYADADRRALRGRRRHRRGRVRRPPRRRPGSEERLRRDRRRLPRRRPARRGARAAGARGPARGAGRPPRLTARADPPRSPRQGPGRLGK
ncbi:trehalose-phosphatase [Clavibacter zhangzhiyongii]|uniref:trehalose-phosphatase n=1 Tax=Clavibacter zhangzhiyongii TaxID=2768071 RepID=UPI0039E12A00